MRPDFTFAQIPTNFTCNAQQLNPVIIKFVASIGGLLTSIALLFGGSKFFSSKPAIILDEYGITDNTGKKSLFIKWDNIKSLEVQSTLNIVVASYGVLVPGVGWVIEGGYFIIDSLYGWDKVGDAMDAADDCDAETYRITGHHLLEGPKW